MDGQRHSDGPWLGCDLPIEHVGAIVHNALVLTGWAVSPVGISGVIVQIDDRLVHASFGLDTPWLAETMPDMAESARAGYRLEIDTSSWEPGPRKVTVAAYDQEGRREEIAGAVDVLPFQAPKYTTDENLAAIEAGEMAMWLERPSPADSPAEVAAPVKIAGWAYTADGVEAVLVTIDGQARHDALHPVFRPDLVDGYGEEVATRAGFVLPLDSRDCPPGWHRLSVVAIGGDCQAVGLEMDFHCLPEPQPVETVAAGEIDWIADRGPAPRRRSPEDDPAAAGARLVEAERRLLEELAAQLHARDLLDADRDDLAALPFDDASFDLVTCFDTIERVPDPDAALDELRRVLRPDGVLFIAASRRGAAGQGSGSERDGGIPGGLERALRDRFANVRVGRRHTLLASLAADDATLAVGDGRSALDVEVRKLGEGRPGGEDTTFALAGDGELPDLPPMAMLAPSSALRDLRGAITMWHDRALLADADAAASRNQANTAGMHQETTLRELRGVERELATLRDSTAESQAQLGQSAADLAEARTELDERQAEAQAQAHRAANAEANLAALQGSLSWRITRPVRAVKRAASRLRR